MRWKPRRPYPSPPTDHCSSSFAPQRGTGWGRLCFAYDSEEVPVCGVRSPPTYTPCSPYPSCPSPLQLVPLLPKYRAACAPPALVPCCLYPSGPRPLLTEPLLPTPPEAHEPPTHVRCRPNPPCPRPLLSEPLLPPPLLSKPLSPTPSAVSAPSTGIPAGLSGAVLLGGFPEFLSCRRDPVTHPPGNRTHHLLFIATPPTANLPFPGSFVVREKAH